MSSSPSKSNQIVSRSKTKTFATHNAFLNWQRTRTLMSTSRALLQQCKAAASWTVLVRVQPTGWGRETALSTCEIASGALYNFELISKIKTLTYGCKSSRGILRRWSGDWTITYKEKEELGLFSLEKRQSKGNLPAACKYLMRYNIDYQKDGARPFSEVHNVRIGGNRCKPEHTKSQVNVWLDFFFKH